MSNKNITIEQKNSGGAYDGVYPATSAAKVKYTNETLGAGVTNVEQALVAIKNLYGSNLPTTTFNKIATGLRKTQLTKKSSDEIYEPIRIETTAEQVPIYSPIDGTLTNLKLLLDAMVEATPNYLCFTANQANSTISMGVYGTPTLGQNFQYSIDRITWNTFTPGTTRITLANVGDKVYFKGNNPNGVNESSSIYYNFVMTGSIAGSGDIMSLIDNGDCTTVAIPNSFCYWSMFKNCTSLTTAPELPATTLMDSCYSYMFDSCTSLESTPELPATTLAKYCYRFMFSACTSLTTTPELPATTLVSYCYTAMFLNCTSLTTVPELPATTLVSSCYKAMFYNCASLYVSDTAGTGYDKAWTMPTNGTFTTNANVQGNMFYNCLGTRSSDNLEVEAGHSYTYYTQNEPV